MNKGMYSSNSGEWDTDPELVRKLAEYFPWDLDVCASGPNVCDNYFTKEDNALEQEWNGLCWMNPPYGRKIGTWLEKARMEAMHHHRCTAVCLVPARTDTKWWHDCIWWASSIVFIKGRLTFGSDEYWSQKETGGRKNSAPFPSAIMVLGNLTRPQWDCLGGLGWMVAQ